MLFSNIDVPESIFTTTTTTAVAAPDTNSAGGVSISFGKMLPHIHSHTNVNLHEQLHQVSMLLHQSRHISFGSLHPLKFCRQQSLVYTTLVLQLVHSPSFVPSVSPPFASLTFAQAESTLLCVPLLLSLGSVEDSPIFYSPYTPPIPTQTTTNTGKRCSGLALTHRLFCEPTSENNDYSITLISTTPVYNHWLGVISLNYSNTLCITQ